MKSTLTNPQVVAAFISGIVALILAIVPTLLNNTATSSPTETPAPITVAVESVSEQPIATPTEIPITPTTIATNEPSPTEVAVILPTATFTEIPIPTATPLQATEAPPANVLLVYDEVSFTIYNQSAQTLSINDLHFRSANASWDATKWGPSLANNFKENNCLRLRDINSGQRQPPSFCGTLLGLQLIDSSLLFWANATDFEVFKGNTRIATCSTDTDTCAIFVP